MICRRFSPALLSSFMVLALLCSAAGQEPGQTTFLSPQEAALALYQAVRTANERSTLAVLGQSVGSVLDSGDTQEDSRARGVFLSRFEQMHRIGKGASGTRIVYVGADNWPFPVSLAQKGGAWYFDSTTGASEILFRRIGQNELSAIRTLNLLVEAQRDLYEDTRGSAGHQYAALWTSTSGKKDGLYWNAVEGEPKSPIGPLLAGASPDSGDPTRGPAPFHGYLYRMLPAQGANVSGGAKPYVVDGKMTDGFAFIAYPAEYRRSGVMTFLVDAQGTIYEKDLGKSSSEAGAAMVSFNPDATWSSVSEENAAPN